MAKEMKIYCAVCIVFCNYRPAFSKHSEFNENLENLVRELLYLPSQRISEQSVSFLRCLNPRIFDLQ